MTQDATHDAALQLFKVTLNWNPDDYSEGDYCNWVWATDSDHAIRLIAEEMADHEDSGIQDDETRGDFIESLINDAKNRGGVVERVIDGLLSDLEQLLMGPAGEMTFEISRKLKAIKQIAGLQFSGETMNTEPQNNCPPRIDLVDGKYSVIADPGNGVFKALRYGKEWRSLTGDKLVLGMFDRIVELQEEVARLQRHIAGDGLRYYAVTGRIPGDDEDSMYVFHVASREEAVALFTDEIYSETTCPEETRANVVKAHGQAVYINTVVVSDSSIEDVG